MGFTGRLSSSAWGIMNAGNTKSDAEQARQNQEERQERADLDRRMQGLKLPPRK